MARLGPALLKDILDTSTPANRSPSVVACNARPNARLVLSCAAKLFNTKGTLHYLADVAGRLGLTKPASITT